MGLGRCAGRGEDLSDWRYRVASTIYGWDKERATVPETMESPTQGEPVVATRSIRSDALTEALAIVNDARDASIEIDWTRRPSSEREAQLRSAIIRRIEKDQAERAVACQSYGPNLAFSTLQALESLLEDPYGEFVGSDPFERLEFWRAVADEELKAERRDRELELREAALRDLRESGDS
jgi:hypothetical protein